ncbi:hypothetical protein F5Y16DRAFT_358115 [Xylariaceae sp. FL0255]|nr:hypothetical protein F5Y16DRAFT_358115 [Xylariaceae sp. FL0255]
MRIGFVGLGTMGLPMALNLTRDFTVTVWNRTTSKYAPLVEAGAAVGETPSQVAQRSDIIFVMLFDAAAIEDVLQDLKLALRGKILVNTSSVPEDFSRRLAQEVTEAGGDFVEMPVSGSKLPAEQGRLVGMMAGDREVVQKIHRVMEPITCAAIYCGPIGSGLRSKYVANLFATTLAVGLAQSMGLAKAQGLDLAVMGEILNAGPMASAYSQSKITKILADDWSPQAATKDCYNSSKMICGASEAVGARTPLSKFSSTFSRGEE